MEFEPLPPGATPAQALAAKYPETPHTTTLRGRDGREYPLEIGAVFLWDGTHRRECRYVQVREPTPLGTAALTMRTGAYIRHQYHPDVVHVLCLGRSERLPGRDVVALAKALGAWMGARALLLADAAFVSCDDDYFDLSLHMLLTQGLTWYMKFGAVPLSFLGPDREERVQLFRAAVSKLRALRAADVVAELKGAPPKARPHYLSAASRQAVDEAAAAAFAAVAAVAKVHPPGEATLAAWLDALRRRDCAQFGSVYRALFENDYHYWRVPGSPFVWEGGPAIFHALQAAAAALHFPDTGPSNHAHHWYLIRLRDSAEPNDLGAEKKRELLQQVRWQGGA